MALPRRGSLKLKVAERRRLDGVFAEGDRSPREGERVGAFLRRGRESAGRTLEQVGRTIRVQPHYLEAIEAGRYGALPGHTYAIGFVRAYSDHLGADTPAIIVRLRRDLAATPQAPELEFPSPRPEARVPANAIMAVCVCVSIGLYAFWYGETTREIGREPFLTVADLDRKLAEEPLRPFPDAAPPATVVDIDRTASADATRSGSGQPLPRSRPGDVDVANAPQAAESDMTPEERAVIAEARRTGDYSGYGDLPADREIASALPAPRLENLPALTVRQPSFSPRAEAALLDDLPAAMQPVRRGAAPVQAAGLPHDGSIRIPGPGQRVGDPAADEGIRADGRIVLYARNDSWIEVRDREKGSRVMSRLLRSGESFIVPQEQGGQDLVLTTGNAGALEVVVDGEVAPTLGGNGKVVRGIDLDGERLLAGTATPE